jgi:acyl-CoA reductase-like NAD-dependent aldehyde dehydrogenase
LEFQGQNVQQLHELMYKVCGSCEQIITDEMKMKMGSPEDFSNFVTAVIHEGSFDKLASFIDQVKKIPMLKSSLEGTTINQ